MVAAMIFPSLLSYTNFRSKFGVFVLRLERMMTLINASETWLCMGIFIVLPLFVFFSVIFSLLVNAHMRWYTVISYMGPTKVRGYSFRYPDVSKPEAVNTPYTAIYREKWESIGSLRVKESLITGPLGCLYREAWW